MSNNIIPRNLQCELKTKNLKQTSLISVLFCHEEALKLIYQLSRKMTMHKSNFELQLSVTDLREDLRDGFYNKEH